MTSTWWWLLSVCKTANVLERLRKDVECEETFIKADNQSTSKWFTVFILFYYIFLIRKIKISGWWFIDQSIPNFRISLKCYIISFGKTVWGDTSVEAKPAITCTRVQISALLLNSSVCDSLILNCTVNTTYA